MRRVLNNNSGFSLISVTMAIGLVGLLSMLVVRQQKLMLNIQTSNEANLEITKFRYQVERVLGESTFCSQVLNDLDIGSYLLENPSPGERIVALAEDDILSYTNSRNLQVEVARIGQRLHRQALVRDIYFSYDTDPENFITLNIELDKKAYNKQGEVISRSLGGQSKVLTVPLRYKISSDLNKKITCKFNDPLLDEKEYCDPDSDAPYFVGFNEDKSPRCIGVNKEIINKINPEIELTSFKSLQTSQTKRVKNDKINCSNRAIASGLSYGRDGGFLGIGKKEKYSLACSSGLSLVKEREINGELESEEFEYVGFSYDREFETKVEKKAWGHCPEGQVISQLNIKKNRDMEIACRNLLFKSKTDNTCSEKEIEEIKSKMATTEYSINQRRDELLQLKISHEQDPNGYNYSQAKQEEFRLNNQIATLNGQIYNLKRQLGNCNAKYISNAEKKSQIIRRTASSGLKKCPNGYFLTGAIIKGKDDYQIRCSQFSALKVK